MKPFEYTLWALFSGAMYGLGNALGGLLVGGSNAPDWFVVGVTATAVLLIVRFYPGYYPPKERP